MELNLFSIISSSDEVIFASLEEPNTFGLKIKPRNKKANLTSKTLFTSREGEKASMIPMR